MTTSPASAWTRQFRNATAAIAQAGIRYALALDQLACGPEDTPAPTEAGDLIAAVDTLEELCLRFNDTFLTESSHS